MGCNPSNEMFSTRLNFGLQMIHSLLQQNKRLQFDENHNENDYNCLLAGVLSLATELAKTELSPIEVSNLHEQLPVY